MSAVSRAVQKRDFRPSVRRAQAVSAEMNCGNRILSVRHNNVILRRDFASVLRELVHAERRAPL